VNSTSFYPITGADGSAFDAADSAINIKGFGTFKQSQIVSANGQRFVAGEKAVLRMVMPSATTIGLSAGEIGVGVVFHVRVLTSRSSSEWATDFIRRGRPVIFELVLDATDTAAQVAAKVTSAITNYNLKFGNAKLPFSAATTTVDGATIVTLTSLYNDLSFSTTYPEFIQRNEIFGYKVTASNLAVLAVTGAVTLAGDTVIPVASTAGIKIGDTVQLYDKSAAAVIAVESKVLSFVADTSLTVETAFGVAAAADDTILVKRLGKEAGTDGKYLEENVMMSTEYNDGAYVIGAGERPDVSANYTAITWKMKTDPGEGQGGTWAPHANLSTVAAGAQTPVRHQTFTLYFKEGTTLFSGGGTVEVFVNWLVAGAPAITDFYLANLTTGANGAAFIA